MTAFEKKWQSNTLFETAYKESYSVVTVARDYSRLKVAEKLWTIEIYNSYCMKVDHDPIAELVEDWQEKIKAQEVLYQTTLDDLSKKAVDIKIEISDRQRAGVTWQQIRSEVQSAPLEISIKNGVWTISYETQLVLLTGPHFASKHRPNEITIKHE